MEKQKCPEVRFKGFTLEWEEFKLENMFTFYRGESFSKSDIVKDGNFKCIHYGELFTKYNSVIDEVLSSTNLKGLNFGRIGDILMPSSDVTPDGLAKASCLKVDNVLLGGDINILRPVSLISSVFISYQINHSKEKILKCVTGTTVKHVYNKDLKELSYLITTFKEQTQIGNFFQNLDQSIALQEKKLSQTQNLKKAMLEKMFPKAGSKQPEIRLKGFSGDWPGLRIFDLAQNGKLNNGVFNDQNKIGKGYKLINVLDMYIETSIDEKKLTLLDLDRKEFEQNKVKYGDVFFTRSSLVKEGIAFSNVYLGHSNDITYDGHLIKLSPNLELVDPIFLNYCLKSSKIRTQLILGGKSTTMTTIGQQEVGETIVGLPSMSEQLKIGQFFKRLDETLLLQQQKLQTLKNLKRAFLEKMFV